MAKPLSRTANWSDVEKRILLQLYGGLQHDLENIRDFTYSEVEKFNTMAGNTG